MKNKYSEIDDEILNLTEKAFPYNFELKTSYLDPLIDILRLTLPVSTGIVVAGLSLEVSLTYIEIGNFKFSTAIAITLIQLFVLFILLSLKQQEQSALNYGMREVYLSRLKPQIEKKFRKELAELEKLTKDLDDMLPKLNKLFSFRTIFLWLSTYYNIKSTHRRLQKLKNILRKNDLLFIRRIDSPK